MFTRRPFYIVAILVLIADTTVVIGQDDESDSSTVITEYLGSPLKLSQLDDHPLLYRQDEFSCSFKENEPCCWSNADDAQLLWAIVREAPAKPEDRFLQEFKQFGQPELPYLLTEVTGAGPLEGATLASCAIYCQNGVGRLSFGHWLSEGVELHICRKRLISTSVEQPCEIVTGSGASLIELPNAEDSYFISISVTHSEVDGIAIIDNIFYNATFCD